MIRSMAQFLRLTARLGLVIIGCAMEVHKIYYQSDLSEKFAVKGLNAIREFEMNVFYKGNAIGTMRVDFLAENVVSVEIKPLINNFKFDLKASNAALKYHQLNQSNQL